MITLLAKRRLNILLTALLAAGLGMSLPAEAERLKDLATIQGVRSNQLIGYSLVVGLDGTGDQTTQTPLSACCKAWASPCHKAPTCS